jgi:Ca2+-binding RTX toxin-like protein
MRKSREVIVASSVSNGFRLPIGMGEETSANDGDGYFVITDFGFLFTGTGLYHIAEDWADEAGRAATRGDPVFSISNGRVIETGEVDTFGLYVLVAHDLLRPIIVGGVETSVIVSLYSDLEFFNVAVGDIVSIGQQIGAIGSTQDGRASHLNFEIRLGEQFENYTSRATTPAPLGWVDPSEFINLFRTGVGATAGDDTLSGAATGDEIDGLGGADSIHGGAGNDTIFGGTSPDTINGGLGNDVLDGGTAFDTLDYSDRTDSGVNVNVINGVALTGGFINSAGFYQGGVQEDTISNFENIFGTMFRDRLIAGSTSARIEGRDGDDFLFAFSGNDTLFGGEGNDVIESNKSSDQLFGENGNDTLNGGTGLDTINGGAGTDTADYGNREGAVSVNLTTNIAVSGGALNSSGFYSGGFTEDSLVSIEAVFGSSFGDRLVAGNFASRLEGRGGNDNISGLGGADTLIGGAGNDTLGGGAGADLFEFASGFGADRITDFDEGASLSDVIRLVGLGASFDSFGEVIAAASQSGADVVFNFGGGNTITVLNATVAAFNANDFEFG